MHTSVLVWCLAHGMVTLELTHAPSSPDPGRFPASPEAGERILLESVRATLLGHGNRHEASASGSSSPRPPPPRIASRTRSARPSCDLRSRRRRRSRAASRRPGLPR
jgi:hypothetical protein